MNDIRQKFWTEVYLAHVSKHAFSLEGAALSADEALRAFDARFGAKQCETNPYAGFPVAPPINQ